VILPLLLALQAVPVPLAARGDTIRPLHDALNHDITIVVSDSGTHMLGQVESRWVLRSPLPVELQLDSALRVIRVLMDGKENTRLFRTMYARESGLVIIPHEKQPGDSLTTMIRYHGDVRDGLIIRDNAYGVRTMFADNWPDRAHGWLPVQDEPGDKVTASFHVEVPPGYRVIANGLLRKVDTLPRGRTIWHYRIDEPVPVYTLVFGAAPFAVTPLPSAACDVKCVPLSVWTYPQDSAWAVDGPFRHAGDIVAWYSRLIGSFPYEDLAHVESTTRYGGMENASAIFYDEQAYARKRLDEQTVAHETAHQWFGDAVTEDDWHHVWLSEGFATYFAALWVEHTGGRPALDSLMQRNAENVFKSPDTGRPILDLGTSDLPSLLNSNSYPKGAWVLHSLRGMLGDSTFFRGIREYYRRFRNGTALSSDLALVMSEAAGTDLDWYFTQALTQPGYPVLQFGWKYARKRLELDVVQTQSAGWGTFRIPNLAIDVDGQRYTIDVQGARTHAVIAGVERRPARIVVDPDHWWLLRSGVTAEQ